MTELIVAFDTHPEHAVGLFTRLADAGVTWFKVGTRTLLEPFPGGGYTGTDLCDIISANHNLFLDLKLYDTRDTVRETACRAFAFGARFLTVHATPSMIEAAMSAKTDDRQKVLAVSHLTDQPPPWNERDLGDGTAPWFQAAADGLVLPVWALRHIHPKDRPARVTVCPGIRPLTINRDYFWNEYIETKPDNHVGVVTPKQARAAGADYIVVGRPIYSAPDPVAAAQAIMEELR